MTTMTSASLWASERKARSPAGVVLRVAIVCGIALVTYVMWEEGKERSFMTSLLEKARNDPAEGGDKAGRWGREKSAWWTRWGDEPEEDSSGSVDDGREYVEDEEEHLGEDLEMEGSNSEGRRAAEMNEEGDTAEPDDSDEEREQQRLVESEEKGTENETVKGGVTSGYVPERDCKSGEVVVDSAGTLCVDLTRALSASLIYKVEETKSPHTSYLYCAIPKNGCTYHLAMLQRLQGAKDYEYAPVIHDAEDKLKTRLASRDSETIGGILLNNSLPKYIVTRNPITRVLSGYLDKVEPGLGEENRTPAYFEQWVYANFAKGADLGKLNPHWKPQMYLCGYNVRDVHRYFRIFRVEEPEGYVNFLYDIVPDKYLRDGWGGQRNLSFREYVLGPRLRSTKSNERVHKYYSRELFEYLADVLRDEIEFLGYKEDVQEIREGFPSR